MAENESSLSELFEAAKSNQEDLDTLDPRSDDFKQLLQSSIASLKQCQDLIDRLALFSSNEDLEDIATTNLQYLGVDYILAELTMKPYSPDRKSQLSDASDLLEKFLTRLDEYTLLSKPDAKLFQTFKEDRTRFRIVGENAGLEAKRNTKIKRFQEEKQLKSRLKLLRDQSQSLNVDDEIIRDLYTAELSLYVHQAFQSLDLISQERAILAMTPSQPDHTRAPDQQPTNDTRANGKFADLYTERLDPSSLLQSNRPHRGILDSAGRPLQPFTLTATSRKQMTKDVFRPDHSLPTMSIDEYLEEERKRGGIIDGGGNAGEQTVEPDEDDMKAQDAATMKAREWDEFVEANPKGAGNTTNRG